MTSRFLASLRAGTTMLIVGLQLRRALLGTALLTRAAVNWPGRVARGCADAGGGWHGTVSLPDATFLCVI
ncbi:MAG: hypothetical protein ACRDSP_13450 [Pseudonocardiaceae bacterium]